MNRQTILIRGAGEIASAIAVVLKRVGYNIVLTELPIPLAIRRTVSFCDAILNGSATVEDIESVKSDIENYESVLKNNKIPLLLDSIDTINKLKPQIYIDARMLKNNILDLRKIAEFTIGVGPGYTVDKNCDVVIETQRGHNMGKLIWNGSTQTNTGIPSTLGGENINRVIRANTPGKIIWDVNIGDMVAQDQVIGRIGDVEIKSKVNGMIRGLISPKVETKIGLKIADVDPRGKAIDFKSISDKSRCISRGVLEAILIHFNS